MKKILLVDNGFRKYKVRLRIVGESEIGESVFFLKLFDSVISTSMGKAISKCEKEIMKNKGEDDKLFLENIYITNPVIYSEVFIGIDI